MPLPSKQLSIKRSSIPKAGKGLFTKNAVPKGIRIIEYTGAIKTWKEITDNPVFNAYVFYVNRNHVIDSKARLKSFGRYVNDAKGPNNAKDAMNNCHFEMVGLRVFVTSTVNIPAGAEILVGYGKAYWDAVRKNSVL